MPDPYPNGVMEAALRDFFTPSFLLATLLPFVAALAVLVGAGGYFFLDLAHGAGDGLRAGLAQLQLYVGDWLVMNEWFSGLLAHEAVRSASLLLFGGLLLYFIFVIALAVQLVVLGFLTPWIAKAIHRRHYRHVARAGFGNSFTGLLYILTVFAIIGTLLVLSIPLLFIPFIGFVIFHFLMFLFFKKMIQRDAASQVLTRAEYGRIKSVNRGSLIGYAGLLYVIALLPIVGLLLQVFYASVFVHFFFREAEELRAIQAFKARAG